MSSMKRYSRKVLALLLASVMAFSGMTVPVNAEETSINTESEEVTNITVTSEGYTIYKNGTYHFTEESTGNVTVASGVSEVTIVGNGVEWNKDTASQEYGLVNSVPYSDILIDCSAASGIALTLKDVHISNSYAGKNVLNFAGENNRLIFDGTVILEQDSNVQGYANIHVGAGTELNVSGTKGSSAYLYKYEMAAGIGGNYYEASGEITFGTEGGANDFYIYMKGSKQGAVIGNGANCSDTPGNITFLSGIYNLVGIARGAIIGGSAGTDSKAAGNVYIKGGLLNLNVDYSGAAIGGGGYESGNDKDGGNVYISGGSIRPYIDTNAVNNGWLENYDIAEAGINDVVITATKLDADGNSVYMLEVPTEGMDADSYTIEVDGETYYSGPRYAYCYYYESVDRQDGSISTTPLGTPGNWVPLTDETNFYLFVTGTDHEILINGEKYKATWNEGEFVIERSILDLSSGQITIEEIEEQKYTGGEVKPPVVIKDGNYVLKEGTDYTVSYSENLVLGEVTVTVTGIGNYKGTAVLTYEIIENHEITEVRGEKEVSCTEDGYTGDTYCQVCGEIVAVGEKIAPVGHTEEVVAGKAASCTEAGLTEGKKCSVCGEVLVEQKEIAATGHTEEIILGKAASCTESGVTEGRKCSVCGEVLVEQEKILAKGHTVEIIAGKAASCTDAGLTDGKKCNVCGEVVVKQEEIAATGHTEVVVKGKAATCTDAGLTDGKKCNVCGEVVVKQEEIAVTGHTEVIVKGKAATCIDEGLTDGKKCSVCGEVLEAQKKITATGHTEEVVKGKAATCTDEGLTDGKKCSVCGEVLEEQKEIAATGHTEEVVKGKAATCTEPGLTDGKKCGVCGEILSAQNEIEETGHSYGGWTVVKSPNCTDSGSATRECSICKYTETRNLNAKGHAWEAEFTVDKAATCIENGSKSIHCANCDAQKDSALIPALGHTEEIVKGKEASCTEPGLTDGIKCAVCGVIITEQEEISSFGHTEVVDEEVEASCTESGLTEGSHCSVCEEVLVAQEEIPEIGHTYEEGACTVCGEADPDYITVERYLDVTDENVWYYDAVYAVTEMGLMGSTSKDENVFSPGVTTTRSMIVTILYRLEGEPEVSGISQFTDVKGSTWYTDAVIWAAENEIVKGYTDGTFGPRDNITREQMAAFLYRYAEYKGYDVTAVADLSGYNDADKIGNWAVESMKWANAESIIKGNGKSLNPKGKATRAEVAVMMMNFCKNAK